MKTVRCLENCIRMNSAKVLACTLQLSVAPSLSAFTSYFPYAPALYAAALSIVTSWLYIEAYCRASLDLSHMRTPNARPREARHCRQRVSHTCNMRIVPNKQLCLPFLVAEVLACEPEELPI